MSGFVWGGSEELWAATALEALKLQHEVLISVFCWPDRPAKMRELERRGAKILRRQNPTLRLQRPSFGALSTYLDVFKASPDVIVVSQGGSFDVVWLRELRELLYLTPIPFILISQFNENLPVLADNVLREHARNIFARAFRVLFVSNQNRIDAERQLARKIPNFDLVLNPVNLSDRSYLQWPQSATARFANVARLETKPKGQDILIEILSADQWKERNWHLTLYGSGPDERYLYSLVELFGLQERITFAGHQSDVRTIWAREQVLVMFSRAEGIPLALVEAMLCGRPAIVSDVGGNQEWITETETGFVAEAPVIGLARAALERAWSARHRWHTMGMQAHKVAAGRISDPSIPGLLEILLDACRHKKPIGAATGEELERLRRYRGLMQPTIGKRVNRLAEAGALRLRNIVSRWRTAHAESQERSLIRLASPREPQ